MLKLRRRAELLLSALAIASGLNASIDWQPVQAQVASGRVVSPAAARAKDAQLHLGRQEIRALRTRIGIVTLERDAAKSRLRELEPHISELRVLLRLPDDTPAEQVVAQAVQWGRLDSVASRAFSALDSQAAGIRNANSRAQAEARIGQAKTDFESGDFVGVINELGRLKAEPAGVSASGEVWLSATRAQAVVARQQRDFALAATLLREAEARIDPSSRERLLEIRKERAEIAYEQGLYLGDNAELAVAISLYQDGVLPLADRNADLHGWVEAQLGLAGAATLLGSRQGGEALLVTAVESYRDRKSVV